MEAMIDTHENNDELEGLSVLFRQARTAEAIARGVRIDYENQIAELIGDTGYLSKTVSLTSGRKITVNRGNNYHADISGLESIDLSGYFPPLRSKTTVTLNIEGYEWYRANNPVIFSAISKFVEVKPKKVAVTIREKKEE